LACNREGETLMGEEPPGSEPAQRTSSGKTIVRKLRQRRWALLTAFPAGGGCLAFGLALTGHSLRRISGHLPQILGESIEIAAGSLIIAAVIAILIVLALVPWCFWAAARNVGDQDMANRWLTENHPRCVIADTQCAASAARPAGSWSGQNCTIVLIDIADFGASTRCDRDRRRIRAVLYQITQSSFENPGQQHGYHCEDRGDGILLIIPPCVPTTSTVNRILDNLVTLLRRHNSTSEAGIRIQMRVALDVGPVVSDAHGVDGLAIILAARLLDAPVLKNHLAETGADLGFITSAFVYDTIIQPNPGHVDPAGYRQLKCRVKRKALNAWMYIAQKSGEIQPPAA
jgi:hypothetical protein